MHMYTLYQHSKGTSEIHVVTMYVPISLCMITHPFPTLTFCHAINWSLSMAWMMLGRLWWTCTKHRAMATMFMWSGPATPMGDRKCWILGVRRNGTGRLASSSPEIDKLKWSSNVHKDTSIPYMKRTCMCINIAHEYSNRHSFFLLYILNFVILIIYRECQWLLHTCTCTTCNAKIKSSPLLLISKVRKAWVRQPVFLAMWNRSGSSRVRWNTNSAIPHRARWLVNWWVDINTMHSCMHKKEISRQV